jgi:hypothetical protein
MVTDHDMRMEALRLFEENQRLRKALSDIAAVTFCPKCHTAVALKPVVEGAAILHNEDPSGQRREPMLPDPLDDEVPF